MKNIYLKSNLLRCYENMYMKTKIFLSPRIFQKRRGIRENFISNFYLPFNFAAYKAKRYKPSRSSVLIFSNSLYRNLDRKRNLYLKRTLNIYQENVGFSSF